jgi:hypothetical protein
MATIVIKNVGQVKEYYDMLTYLKPENNDKIILQSPQQ